jgi:NitT/TauT family transport system substrate-binding protein
MQSELKQTKTSIKLRQSLLRLALAFVLGTSLALAGCQTGNSNGGDGNGGSTGNSGNGSVKPDAPLPVRVASLKGPTSIGLVNFMEQEKTNPDATPLGAYVFNIYGTADEILPLFVSGEIDIALVSANVAAVLYNRTTGGVVAININTLGVLYVVSADDSINSLNDLKGRTVLMTGKGTTPDYVMSYLLAAQGLDSQVTLEFKSEATELAAAINADPTAIALLPEPYVTAVCSKNPSLSPRISLSDEWQSVQPNGKLVTGVTVVSRDFLGKHPDVVDEFIAAQADSVVLANNNPASTAELVVQYGIIDSASVATEAIPRSNLVCIVGTELQSSLGAYLEVLYKADPESIGGILPTADFYYY